MNYATTHHDLIPGTKNMAYAVAILAGVLIASWFLTTMLYNSGIVAR